MDPVFQDKKTGAGSEGHIDRGVIVSEDKVIYVMNRGELLCKLHQRFVRTAEDIFLVMGKAVAPRPSVSEAEGYPWMQKAEEELGYTAMEYATQKTVAERNRSQTVAMPQTELLSGNLNQRGLSQLYHSQFLKVGICPYVMVSFKEIHLDTSVQDRKSVV